MCAKRFFYGSISNSCMCKIVPPTKNLAVGSCEVFSYFCNEFSFSNLYQIFKLLVNRIIELASVI